VVPIASNKSEVRSIVCVNPVRSPSVSVTFSPPATSTCPVSDVAGGAISTCASPARGWLVLFAVAVQVPAVGLNNSAVASVDPVNGAVALIPPVTRIRPANVPEVTTAGSK